MSSKDTNYDYEDYDCDYYDFYDKYPEDGTPLQQAVFLGDLNLVQSLLDEYLIEDEVDGRTLLHIAAACGHHLIVNLFCQQNFPIDEVDKFGDSPLHLAIRKGRSEVFNVLLEKCNLNAKNYRNEALLYTATVCNRTEFSMQLIQNGANVNEECKDGRTPLILAIENKNFDVVQILLEKGAKVNVKDKFNMTPLQYAINWGNLEVVKLLMSNSNNSPDKDFRILLASAIADDRLEIVKYLIKNSSIIVPKNENCLPNRYPSEYFTGFAKYPYFMSESLIRFSHLYGSLRIWKHLVKCSSKIDLNTYYEFHHIVQAGQIEIVKEFLEQHNNEVNHDSLASKLAVYIAVESENEEMLKILLKAGYSVESCYIDRTPLHIAATFQHTRLVEILLEAGADVNSRTRYDESPLDFAIAAGHSSVVKFFLKFSADTTYSCSLLKYMSERNMKNLTPLRFQKLLKITEMLIKEDCRITTINEDYYLILFRYAMRIRVSKENEQNNNSLKLKEEASNEEGANKLEGTIKDGEFCPEILSCLLNYVKYENIEDKLQFEIIGHFDINPGILDVSLEYTDYKLHCCRFKIYLDRAYKSNLLLIVHTDNVDCLTSDVTALNSPVSEKLQDHVLKLIVARLVLLPKDLNSRRKKRAFCKKHNLVEWRRKCKRQIRRMKKTEIVDESNVTFFDIITQPVNKIANYLRNEHLKEILESSDMKFPAYAEFLKVNVEKGKRRRNLIDTCVNFMLNFVKNNCKIQFSIAEIDLIFQYFSVRDLLNFFAACS